MAEQLDETRLLDRVEFFLDYARRVYGEYMACGKQFLYASILYSVNDELKNTLLRNIENLPKAKRDAAMDLVFHIDVWQRIWDEQAAAQSPACDSQFVFENRVNFPGDSVAELLRRS